MELTEIVRQREQWRMVKRSIAREKRGWNPQNFFFAATPTLSSRFWATQSSQAPPEIICAICEFFSRIDSFLRQPLSCQMISSSTARRRGGFAGAASKPAPFAEKKNAKDAAPLKSIRRRNRAFGIIFQLLAW